MKKVKSDVEPMVRGEVRVGVWGLPESLDFKLAGLRKRLTFQAESYQPELDGVRGLAVTLVLLFHVGLIWEPLSWVKGGYVGVDVFYFLTGFLMIPKIIERVWNRNFSFSEFYSRRARRLMPEALLMMAVTLAICWLISGTDLLTTARSVIYQSVFLANHFFVEVVPYDSPHALEYKLLHTWSLATEEQFYILFPVLFWVFGCVTTKRRLWGILFLVLLFAGSFYCNIRSFPESAMRAYFLLPMRAWEIIAGGGLGLWLRGNRGFKIGRLSGLVGVAGWCAIGYAALCFDLKETRFPSWNALYPIVGTGLLVLAGREHNWCRKVLCFNCLGIMGLISYSLYLWHWPIICFCLAWLTEAWAGPVSLVGSLIAGTASCYWVGNPFRRNASIPLLFVGAVVVLVAGVFALVWNSALVGLELSAVSAIGLAITSAYVFVRLLQNRLLKPFESSLIRTISLVFLLGISWNLLTTSSRVTSGQPGERKQVDPLNRPVYFPYIVVGLDRVQADDVVRLGDWKNVGKEQGEERIEVLVWGDSHAMDIAQGMDLVLRDAGKPGVQITYHGTPPILGGVATGNYSLKEKAAAWVDETIAFCQRNQVQKIVMAAGWNEQRSAKVPETVRFLRDAGFQVFVVMDVPLFEKNESLRFRERLKSQSSSELDIALIPRVSIARDDLRQPDVEAVLASGGLVIDRRQLFIAPDGENYWMAIDGEIAYRDNQHLNEYGRVAMKKLLQQVLKR